MCTAAGGPVNTDLDGAVVWITANLCLLDTIQCNFLWPACYDMLMTLCVLLTVLPEVGVWGDDCLQPVS